MSNPARFVTQMSVWRLAPTPETPAKIKVEASVLTRCPYLHLFVKSELKYLSQIDSKLSPKAVLRRRFSHAVT